MKGGFMGKRWFYGEKRYKRENGQAMLEYALLVVFIVVAGIVVWRIFGENIKKMLIKVNNQIVECSDLSRECP